jgi:hypothetical protein
MAYGLKYTIPFKDIDNNTNLVEIYQDGFVGSSTELIATDAPAVHKYEREDNEDILSPIMSSTLTISFYSTDTTDFTNFFSYSDREFYVVHKFDGDIVFKGYLLNDIVGEPFQDPPYPVVLTATDALAQLKEVALTGPSVDTDLGTLVFQQLNTLNLSMDFEICNDLYEGLVMDNTKSIFSQDEDENLLVQAGTFDALGLNAFQFLEEVCRTFGWVLMQSNEKWVFQRPIARNVSSTVIYLYDFFTGELTSSTANPMTLETVADQTKANTDWVPVNSDQLLAYQRPIKKLTLTQGDLGQSIIANGEDFNENSWSLDAYYRPNNWTINIDPDNIPQVFPANIPSQASWDDEKGVNWDFRLISTTFTIESDPIFLDNAGLIIDFESQVTFKNLPGVAVFYFKHTDVNNNVKYLTTEAIVGKQVLTWSSSREPFVFNQLITQYALTCKVKSFILPAPGFLQVEIHAGGTFLLPNELTVSNVKLTPTYLGEKNPSEVKKVYQTTRAYTTVREDNLVFSDLCIAASKNWFKIGGLPAIVFVEKSLASTPGIIEVPSGAVTQVNRLTDTLGLNTVTFSGGVLNGQYQRQYVAASGFTISSAVLSVTSPNGTPPFGTEILPVMSIISTTQRNFTVTFNNYDFTGGTDVQIIVTLKDANNNTYQVSTFLFQVTIDFQRIYSQTDISFEAQSTESSYSPTLRDCYARNVLTIYNALSYRLEGSFRRKGNDFGYGFVTTELDYSGYTTVRMQIIGWEYDLASRVARIIFGQVPTAYVYPIN